MTTAALVFFPLDRQLKVAGERWSDGLRKLAVWLDGLLTFERAESVLAQVGQLSLSDTTAWRQAQACGAQAQALEAAQRAAATAVPDRQQIMPGEAQSDARPGGCRGFYPLRATCGTLIPAGINFGGRSAVSDRGDPMQARGPLRRVVGRLL